ncbi:MAG: ComF family protein, partial [Flavobacteriaceae bacterium]
TKKTFFLRTDISKEIFDVNFSEENFDKHFLLIDDVMTSGTTLEQCAKALFKIPNAKISIVTMALTH